MKNTKIENLKKQWKSEMYLSLFDEFENVEYYGYNDMKLLFNKDYVMTFNLSDKLQVELKNEDLQHVTENYSDEWRLIGEYDNNILIDKYDIIWKSEVFTELRKFVVDFYYDLCYRVSKLVTVYYYEGESVDNDTIKGFINDYLNENLN